MTAAILEMPSPKKGRGRPKSQLRRASVLNLKGTPEFAAWLVALAEHCNQTQADAVTQALIAYAEQRGFRPPPLR